MYKKIVWVVIGAVSLFQVCIAYQPITIMTAPVGKTGYGHRQVTESLLRGLTQLGIPFVYNPSRLDQVTDTVVVLAAPETLQQAITLKKMGYIKYLLAGPNIMVRADEYGGILAFPEVDLCIVPSAWVAIAYEEEMPVLQGRIRSWYAGVDTNYWRPARSITPATACKQVLIYWKTESEAFIAEIESVVRAAGFTPLRLRYGAYTREQYKTILDDVVFAVFVSRSESQGIALAEAWSMNVPTLVWNPAELHAHGRVYSQISACPYLTESTGRMWQHLEELRNSITIFSTETFSPRQWVIDSMSDVVSARMLLHIIKDASEL